MSDTEAPQRDPVASALAGFSDATHLLAVLAEGCAPADAVRDAILQVAGTGDGERFRAMCRSLQELLESRR